MTCGAFTSSGCDPSTAPPPARRPALQPHARQALRTRPQEGGQSVLGSKGDLGLLGAYLGLFSLVLLYSLFFTHMIFFNTKLSRNTLDRRYLQRQNKVSSDSPGEVWKPASYGDLQVQPSVAQGTFRWPTCGSWGASSSGMTLGLLSLRSRGLLLGRSYNKPRQHAQKAETSLYQQRYV